MLLCKWPGIYTCSLSRPIFEMLTVENCPKNPKFAKAELILIIL